MHINPNIRIVIIGMALILINGIIFAQAPTITSFTPATQSFGGTVTINGTDFTPASVVNFGGTNATSVSFISANQIQAVVGCGTSGTISVTTVNGTGTRAGFIFNTSTSSVAQPGSITGTANVCGYSTLTYTIRKVTNATSYQWTMGTGSSNTITSNNGAGVNDTSITVTFAPGFCTRDTIYVRAESPCATSVVRSFALNATYAPATPASIVNSNPLVCIGETTTISVTPTSPSNTQSNTAVFRWTPPANTTIISANADSSSIQLTLNPGFAGTSSGANISAKAQNACGVQSASGVILYINYAPAQPQNITSGTQFFSACVGNVIRYTAVPAAVSTANRATASFRWIIPARTEIIDATEDSSQILLQFNASYSGGILRTTPLSSCGRTGTFRQVTLTSGPCPTSPNNAMTGETDLCPFFVPLTGLSDTLTYTVPAVPGITRYNWVLPGGATQVSGDTSNSIGIVFDTTVLSRYGQGFIYVGTVSNLGIHCLNYASTRVYFNKPRLDNIVGVTDICPYVDVDTPITYSIPLANHVTSYQWSVPAGVTIFSGQGTNTVQLKFSSGFVSGSKISVTGVSNCGNSTPRSYTLYRRPQSAMPAVIQESFDPSVPAVTNVAGLASVTLRIQKVPNAIQYNWELRNGANASITHLNAAGPDDTAIVVNFAAGFLKDTVSVSSQTACNTSNSKSILLSALATPPAVTSISGEVNPCRNSTYTYTATSAVPTASQAPVDHFRWTVPANATIVATNADSSSIDIQFNGSFNSGVLIARSVSLVDVVSPVYFRYGVRFTTPCNPARMIAGNLKDKNSMYHSTSDEWAIPEVFPNPTSKDFFIRSPFSALPANGHLIVTDLAGKTIEKINVSGASIIRFGDKYKSGTYIVKLILGQNQYVRKVIKR